MNTAVWQPNDTVVFKAHDRKLVIQFTTRDDGRGNQKMLWSAAVVFLLVESASCLKCPDGKVCSDIQTCCFTQKGYACCPYPNAVCCDDLDHCCPHGYHCNMATKQCVRNDLPWDNLPRLEKVAAEPPSLPALPLVDAQEPGSAPAQSQGVEDPSVVHCDSLHYCPSGTTCCRHPTGLWFCCPYSPVTLTALIPASNTNGPAAGVIRCDSRFYCLSGTSCCRLRSGGWGCCQYPLGQCCADGLHCCEYGYTCDPNSTNCRKWYSQVPADRKEDAKQD
ncbi:granulin 1 isoform X2 [Hypomesus transpacificus]|uniref:granulin 1 isoform X2 n=1 Tax=Hypomesus transpacificus TaxID=137520 RepID=UPI001F07B6D7|nr:granulin 1 isoform X2 [Hypomesus transpacificus]